jgi:hypothetical protein
MPYFNGMETLIVQSQYSYNLSPHGSSYRGKLYQLSLKRVCRNLGRLRQLSSDKIQCNNITKSYNSQISDRV